MTPDQARALLAPAVSAHISESEALLYLVAEPDGAVRYANRGAHTLLDIRTDSEPTCMLWDLLTEADRPRIKTLIADGIDGVEACPINFVGGAQDCETFSCRLWMTGGYVAILGESSEAASRALRSQLIETNNRLVVNSRELTRRTRQLEHARKKLQEAFDELETSYWHLKKIQEVLPICMECGKVKTSGADWEDVVEYLQRNALFLSHGYCPECAKRVMDRYSLTEEEDAAESS